MYTTLSYIAGSHNTKYNGEHIIPSIFVSLSMEAAEEQFNLNANLNHIFVHSVALNSNEY